MTILTHHRQEWQESCISSSLIDLNLRSQDEDECFESLFYSQAIRRLNTNVLPSWILTKYHNLKDGGWATHGLDPSNAWDEMNWGVVKPDSPRIDDKGKKRKYEHPFKIAPRCFFLRVDWLTGSKVAALLGRAEEYQQRRYEKKKGNEATEDKGFWQWILENNLPITVVEGVKKAAAALSAGYAAIALPGINGGYRSKDGNGIKCLPYLIPEIAKFATENRQINICFDNDTKPKTIQNVNIAIARMGKLFKTKGCEVKNVTWTHPSKGLDDLKAAFGEDALHKAFTQAKELDSWSASLLKQLSDHPDIIQTNRYLKPFDVPTGANLIAIKSPKGTGKTKVFEALAQGTNDRNERVLVIAHRVQLGRALCERLGLPFIDEVKELSTSLGFGLCVDSLHPNSQARFNPKNYYGASIIIDEVEQVISHVLNSTTCQNNRVSILKTLKETLENAIAGGGQLYIADADLSDVSIDFFREFLNVNLKLFLVENKWIPEQRRQCYKYSKKEHLVAALFAAIEKDKKTFVCLSAQKPKGKYSTCTLEAEIIKRFPSKKILRVDSESVSNPNHPAFGCVNNLDQVLLDYDVVLASPSLETGVSIDIKGHFDSVWGIFQGVTPEESARQFLARVREGVPRHIWAAKKGVTVGNGSLNQKSILDSLRGISQANLKLLTFFDACQDTDLNSFQAATDCWSKMAARTNIGMNRYSEAIYEGLEAEGYEILTVADNPEIVIKNAKDVKESLKTTSEELLGKERQQIANSPDITSEENEKLKAKRTKTKKEQYIERKHLLQNIYGLEVTPQLVAKDDKGWHPQLKLYYYLTAGRKFLEMEDVKSLDAQKKRCNGAVWMPDFNKNQLSTPVCVLNHLKLTQFLSERDRGWRAEDPELIELADFALKNRLKIKGALGVWIGDKDTPIAIANKLLKIIGYKLPCIKREQIGQLRVRVYGSAKPIHEGYEEVFEQWLERDEVALIDWEAQKASIFNSNQKPRLQLAVQRQYDLVDAA